MVFPGASPRALHTGGRCGHPEVPGRFNGENGHMPRGEFLLLCACSVAAALVYGLEALLIVRLCYARVAKRPEFSKFFSRPALVIHSLAIAGLLCFLYAFFMEPYWIDCHHITLATPRIKATPVRIVQISDLHCDRKLRLEKKLSEVINPLKPDIIVFTGDALNTTSALPLLKETLDSLQAGIGKYAVRGNFDCWFCSLPDLFEGTGFMELDEKSVMIQKGDETLCISGLRCGASPESLPGDCAGSRFHILLYHTPDLIEDLQGKNIDLYLAGHTHGGQIALPFFGALITFSRFWKKYESGYHRVNGTVLYVNRGIGMEPNFPIRICSRPEITVIDVVPEKK